MVVIKRSTLSLHQHQDIVRNTEVNKKNSRVQGYTTVGDRQFRPKAGQVNICFVFWLHDDRNGHTDLLLSICLT